MISNLNDLYLSISFPHVFTDICIRDNLPEVEIFSLLEEKLPKYRVRADFLTDFSGYANNDWYIKAPALDVPDKGLGLTKEQARETLHYFREYRNLINKSNSMRKCYIEWNAINKWVNFSNFVSKRDIIENDQIIENCHS